MVGFLSILAVGFFLGMRHATDPDHVIAVTTIVSNQRNRMRAAMIGAFWGLGHTVTIFVVGAGIILFNLVIPVRIGLSMELSVAVMLIILGLVNVSHFSGRCLADQYALPMERRCTPIPIATETTSIAIHMRTSPSSIPTRPTKLRWVGWTGPLAGSGCINIFGRSWWEWFTDSQVLRLWRCWSSRRFEIFIGPLLTC